MGQGSGEKKLERRMQKKQGARNRKGNIDAKSKQLLLLLSRFGRVRLCVTPQTQPTRLPRPWDSPGKNTGVGCHFFLQCMKVKSDSEVAQWCPTLSDPMDCSLPGSSAHGIFQARVLEWGAIAVSNSGAQVFLKYISFCICVCGI